MFPYTMKNFCGMIIPVLIETLNSRKTKPNSLIDTIASNYGYRRKLPYANLLTHSLSYLKSRDAIASKNSVPHYCVNKLLKLTRMPPLHPGKEEQLLQFY